MALKLCKLAIITLNHISEMFNDIFGVVLWKGLIEDKPADPGEKTGNKKS